MRRRCPRSVPDGAALLRGWSLRIALPENEPGGPGWATVAPDPNGAVPGALFRLHPDDLPALDDYEGYPELYLREELFVEAEDGTIRALLYRMPEPLRPARPTARYAEVIRKGYQDFGLETAALERTLREADTPRSESPPLAPRGGEK